MLAFDVYPADLLYQELVRQPPPPPLLLNLEGRFVGRGGEGVRLSDGIARRFRVNSGQLSVWHVSEFSRTCLPGPSHGQFHRGDTYVIRWPFDVVYTGLREMRQISSSSSEQCAYFFWQGCQSRVSEQGAAALMTIELDEERGPQVRD
ncbi:unnamed protein product [Protopolystoma xenopodis]|uniref:Gelsolin-like domain-containing protein n=1 Tax=Protopolystoma xenopodis TaxID=117903 RepID=A0A448WQF4_9PLAT|nr:unnamed protein product [Protopolystoma xenopodis]